MNSSHIIKHLTALLLLALMSASGCSYFSDNLQEGIKLTDKGQYDQAVNELNQEIKIASDPASVAQAYKYRGIAKTGLKEYRDAYSDLQIAWKLSCTLAPKFIPPNGPKSSTFEDCNKNIPQLLNNVRPFLSDFATIMATQKAAEIMKRKYPAFAE